MKSLERRFNNIIKTHPEWSTLFAFNETVYKQHFSDKRLTFFFYKLVNKEDYDFKDYKLRQSILGWAIELTNKA